MTSKKATTEKATTKKATEKKEKQPVPVHKVQVEKKEYRKNIIKSVEGKASSLRDENGKKLNRLHTVVYKQGKKTVTDTLQIVYGKQLVNHTEKNILELKNSRGSVYYFIPKA